MSDVIGALEEVQEDLSNSLAGLVRQLNDMENNAVDGLLIEGGYEDASTGKVTGKSKRRGRYATADDLASLRKKVDKVSSDLKAVSAAIEMAKQGKTKAALESLALSGLTICQSACSGPIVTNATTAIGVKLSADGRIVGIEFCVTNTGGMISAMRWNTSSDIVSGANADGVAAGHTAGALAIPDRGSLWIDANIPASTGQTVTANFASENAAAAPGATRISTAVWMVRGVKRNP